MHSPTAAFLHRTEILPEEKALLTDLFIGIFNGVDSIPILRRNLDLIFSADDAEGGGDRDTMCEPRGLGEFDIADRESTINYFQP